MELNLFVRIQRDGRWQNLDLTELTEPELKEFFSSFEKEKLISWIISIISWIKKT